MLGIVNKMFLWHPILCLQRKVYASESSQPESSSKMCLLSSELLVPRKRISLYSSPSMQRGAWHMVSTQWEVTE